MKEYFGSFLMSQDFSPQWTHLHTDIRTRDEYQKETSF